jgi:RimJ/RimL family protein N-acetyltransferase
VSEQPAFDPQPVELANAFVRVHPLHEVEPAEFLAVAQHESIWRYMPSPAPHDEASAAALLDEARQLSDDGLQLPFAIRRVGTDELAGSSRYIDIRRPHRGIEIGFTWVAPAFQRSVVNTATKRLLIGHAFDDLGALRVQLKTDLRNVQSQTAIARLGAVREGVLRQHVCMPDGYVRDTVMYSITRAEWPAVRDHLDDRLARDSPPT